MRKITFWKYTCLLVVGIFLFGGIWGCGKGQNTNPTEGSTHKGTITMAGSTSMQKVAEALREGFMQANPGVNMSVEYNGSTAGIQQMLAGVVSIGNASRGLKESEKKAGAVGNIVAIDALAVIVNKENGVQGLAMEELKAIYGGKIRNWKEVGGANMPVVVIGREVGSGTRGAFEEILNMEYSCAYVQELDATGMVLATVASTEGAIGYVSWDVCNDSVEVMDLDEVALSEENVRSGNYPLSRPYIMATKGEIFKQEEEVQAFFAYMESEEAREIIRRVGLILPWEQQDNKGGGDA